MWNKFKRENPICEQYREALEDLPPEIDRLTASAELSNSVPARCWNMRVNATPAKRRQRHFGHHEIYSRGH